MKFVEKKGIQIFNYSIKKNGIQKFQRGINPPPQTAAIKYIYDRSVRVVSDITQDTRYRQGRVMWHSE